MQKCILILISIVHLGLVVYVGMSNKRVEKQLAIVEKIQNDMIIKDQKIKEFKTEMIAMTNMYETTRNEMVSLREDLKIKDVLKAVVTAYSPRGKETDDTPFTTAFMMKVSTNIIAVSRNILHERGWTAGDKVYIEGIGIKTIGDLMNKRYNNRIDIFYFSTEDAIKFGKKNLTVALLKT